MKALRYLILLFLQAFCFIAFSQKQNINFEHLDINSGLSQNHVRCILQDSQGFMWFGTSDGLNKYDDTGLRYIKIIQKIPIALAIILSQVLLKILKELFG